MPPPSLSDYAAYTERRAREQPLPSVRPLVSIVTVTLNAAETLERTIRSVREQTLSSIEQVFVDGGSTDGTLQIIRRMARSHDYSITERDSGISDAFNKGVSLARGRFVQILNANDWLSPDQIERACETLEATGADFVFGDLIFYDQGQPAFVSRGNPRYGRFIHRRMPLPGHPAVLASRDCFERIGLFDPRYRNAMDYDWLLRLHRTGGRGVHCPAMVGYMTYEGVSNLQFKRTIDEVKAIAIANGRNHYIASVEARTRFLKTSTSLIIKKHAPRIYRLIRRAINRSYQPMPTTPLSH